MPIVAYYSDWRERRWTCSCGWAGTGDEAAHEPFAELLQVDCPACGHRVCLVPYPDAAETAEAAALGHPEAVTAQAAEARRAARDRRRQAGQLRRPRDLPALEGVAEVRLLLELEAADGEATYRLLADGEVLHTELAAWEDTRPLARMLRHAQARYGERLAGFEVCLSAWTYLAGDSLRQGREVDAMLEAAGFGPGKDGDAGGDA